ncbi:family 10 glycosylhydrolase [Paenibacillus cremeus]|nr:family 10 glycosylhydrolase [Paenibacillus cremeus]
MTSERLWWQKPLRIIQFNLQQKDAPLMDAEKIARESEEMGANVIVINAGGIVGWYPSQVRFHHVNEYMENGRDILREILDTCHARDIKVIARFDFALAEDYIYHQNPQWFARNPDGTVISRGNDRPGLWRRLYTTCINNGYQNEAVGLAVLNEVLDNYDVDGIFWNGGYSSPCWCGVCQEKYLTKYGKPIPEKASEFEADWLASCNTESTQKYWDLMRTKAPDKLFTRYYFPFNLDLGHNMTLPADNINERSRTGNMLCTEAQDVLSKGQKNIPEWSEPAIRMKMGRTMEELPSPIGIIHACPGMDWRHVGLPVPEFLYWSAQIKANGGSHWSTLTGICDTIEDKRILDGVTQLNQMIKKVEDDMDEAKCAAQVLLLSDDGTYVQGWADGLISNHIEFEMMAHYQLDLEKMKRYSVVVIPKGFAFPEGASRLLEEYVSTGGHLIVEGTSGIELSPVLHLLGIEGQIVCSEPMVAAYQRIEPAGSVLHTKLGNTGLVPLRGKVGFCVPKSNTEIYTTWVPPFAPADSVGAPPERASLPAAQTQVPLSMISKFKSGKVMYLAYEPSRLYREYGLNDFCKLIGAYIDIMLGEKKQLEVHAPHGVQISLFKKDNLYMLHLVNGVGQRPIKESIACHNIKFSLKLKPGQQVNNVEARISGRPVPYEVRDDVLTAELEELGVWDMVCVEFLS